MKMVSRAREEMGVQNTLCIRGTVAIVVCFIAFIPVSGCFQPHGQTQHEIAQSDDRNEPFSESVREGWKRILNERYPIGTSIDAVDQYLSSISRDTGHSMQLGSGDMEFYYLLDDWTQIVVYSDYSRQDMKHYIHHYFVEPKCPWCKTSMGYTVLQRDFSKLAPIVISDE